MCQRILAVALDVDLHRAHDHFRRPIAKVLVDLLEVGLQRPTVSAGLHDLLACHIRNAAAHRDADVLRRDARHACRKQGSKTVYHLVMRDEEPPKRVRC
jgi:hypothetical protein